MFSYFARAVIHPCHSDDIRFFHKHNLFVLEDAELSLYIINFRTYKKIENNKYEQNEQIFAIANGFFYITLFAQSAVIPA